MISENERIEIVGKTLRKIFGEEYLQKYKNHVCIAAKNLKEGDRNFMAFLGFQTSDDRPHMKADKRGWTVFAEIHVDLETGEVTECRYQTDEEDP